MFVIHEVEVDMIKKDNLSLNHYNVFLSCFSYFNLLQNNCGKYNADN